MLKISSLPARQYTLSLAILLFCISSLLGQTKFSIAVSLEGGRAYTDDIPVYSLQNKLVATAVDVCNALKITPTVTNQSVSISTLSKAQHRLVLELKANNHFIKIQNATENKPHRIIQLDSPLILYGDKIYLEPHQAAILFGMFLDAKSDTLSGVLSFDFTQPFSLDTAKASVPIEMIARHTIQNIIVEEKVNGVIVRIISTKPNLKYEFIPPDKNGFAYLTFVGATGDMQALSQTFKNGFLRRIKPISLRGSLQLTFEFDAQKYTIKSTDLTREQGTNNFILLALRDVNVQEIIEQENKEVQINATLDEQRSKWKLDVIALDAGHGGKDVGAIGASGHYEKDITLAIVKKVGKLIEKNWKDVKVVYTRDSDKFVELDERGKIANRHNAKLFVSVHCNASVNRKADGVEVYLLGLHKTDAALKVAQRENAVMVEESDYQERYKNFTEENLIMVTMAQNAFVHQSEKLAEIISNDIARRAARQNRGVKQAGFMVLWTPSMPSILIETGYISNPNEEKFLASETGQTLIAEAIFEGLEKYRRDYEAQVSRE
ncbi:MAG: N-acetylmuramoyl-L-alanine amidase [Chloroherpetonaceae bacterium]